MHNMPYNMHNMQNVNMQNNMQINMQNMQAICRFGADCLVLTVICRICQIICSICRICYDDFQYAQYALPTLLMMMIQVGRARPWARASAVGVPGRDRRGRYSDSDLCDSDCCSSWALNLNFFNAVQVENATCFCPRGACDCAGRLGSGSPLFYINTWAMIWPTDYPALAGAALWKK